MKCYKLNSMCLFLILFTVPYVMGLYSESVYGAAPKRLYAVAVGVDQFQDKTIPALALSSGDARDFAKVLKTQGQSLGLETDITLLVNDEATRSRITEALREKLKSAKNNDVVILYFSGHGAKDPSAPDEFYYLTYDAHRNNLYGTALLMNDPRLLRHIESERMLMIADTCFSGEIQGIRGAQAKSLRSKAVPLEKHLKGRRILTSSNPDEESYEDERFGNSIFTHFLIKGLRGAADSNPLDGVISVKELYGFVANGTSRQTEQRQNPMIFPASSYKDDTPLFLVQKFDNPLEVKAQFEYVDREGNVKPLTNDSKVPSGTNIGVAFRPLTDCYIYIFWLDSSGKAGRLFPNPKLTAGDPFVKAGNNYWLPAMREEKRHDRWYVLDDNVGEETIYLIAARKRNTELENAYTRLASMSQDDQNGEKGLKEMKRLKRSLYMGFQDFTAKRKNINSHFKDRKGLFESLGEKLQTMGAEFMYKVTFKHVAPK